MSCEFLRLVAVLYSTCSFSANNHGRYHHLNHHALFGGGYRSGAISIMKRLISKYGPE